MKRRDFFRHAGMLTVPLVLPGSYHHLVSRPNDSQVIIVGTGYGASVAALRLAEHGIPSTMLEMGRDWRDGSIPFDKVTRPTEHAVWLRKKSIAPFGNIFLFKNQHTGVLDRLDYDNIRVYVGRGVGGGSIVNGGMAVTPRQLDFKQAFPQLNVALMFEKYFPLARKTLGVNDIDPTFYENTQYYHYSRVGEKQARKAGFRTTFVPNVYDFKYMQQEADRQVPQSALDREVIYGNNHGKRSLDKTYLAQAMQTGLVNILPLHRVETISEDSNGGYGLKVDVLNTQGEVIQQKQMNCRYLFLGAGSMGTTSLLVKSTALSNMRNTTSSIGHFWGNNGNVMTGRNFVKGGVHRKQSCIPVVSIDNRDDEENYFLAEIAPLPMNMETWTTLYLMIARPDDPGSFHYDHATQSVKLSWSKSNSEKLRETARRFVKIMNKHNGGTRSHLLFKNGIGENICYHPLGGCVLGKATDSIGRLKGHKGIYIVDGALVPGSIGANPFLTITALAEYCVENIIKEDFGS